MNTLKKHGPKLMFLGVLVLCGLFVWSNYDDAAAQLREKRIEENRDAVTHALEANKVSAKWSYNEERAKKLADFHDSATKNIERLTRTSDDPVPQFESYPQPVRPKSEAIKPGAEPQDVFATYPQASDIKARADQGIIYVSFKIPHDYPPAVIPPPVSPNPAIPISPQQIALIQKAAALRAVPKPDETRMTKVIRAEIFRGLAPNKIDMSKPYGTVPIAPEIDPPATTPAATAPVTPDAPRRTRGSDTKKKDEKPKIPPELLWVRAFKDGFVDQNITYYYKVRLIGRFNETDGREEIIEKSLDGNPKLILRYRAPKDTDPVAAQNPGVKLIATKPSEAVSATAPSNFTLRLAGVTGDLPKEGVPRDPAHPLIKTYTGNFEVGVWLKDSQTWERKSITAQEGDLLKGVIVLKSGSDAKVDNKDGFPSGSKTLKYKGTPFHDGDAVAFSTLGGEIYRIKSATDSELTLETPLSGDLFDKASILKAYDFTNDLGYKLIEINMQEPQKDANDKGSIVASSRQLIEVATLENQKTKKLEQYQKTGNLKAREDWFKQLDQIVEQQAVEKKADQERIKASIEKNKTEADERREKAKEKADAAAAAAAPPPAAPSNSTSKGKY